MLLSFLLKFVTLTTTQRQLSLQPMLHVWMQVQGMIKSEVKRAIKKNEKELKSLTESVELHSEDDYESCLENLEVSSRGDISVPF